MADAAESFLFFGFGAYVEGVDCLGCILNDKYVMLVGNLHNLVHITGNTRIVDRNYDLCFICDERFYRVGINVGIILLTVGEDNPCTLSDKCKSRRYESITRYNHLIARLNIAQDGGHLKCICATCGEKTLLETITLPKIMLTPLGKLTVAGEFAVEHRLIHIVGLFAGEVGFVEGNHRLDII